MTTVVYDGHGTAITVPFLLHAYRLRHFPMADDRNGPFSWRQPATRAVITWDQFKIPRSLKKQIRKRPYEIREDTAFSQVIQECAQRSTTWISHDIQALYQAAHEQGLAHSVEAWCDNQLVGGCYGLAVDGVFCGESMFHRADDAAKMCVVHLIKRLQNMGFVALDCQQQTPHMQRLGAVEISDKEYAHLLELAAGERQWLPLGACS